MKTKHIIGGIVLSLYMLGSIEAQDKAYIAATPQAHVKVHGLNIGDVQWTRGFWKSRFDLCKNNVIPAEWDYFMNFSENNFRILAGEVKPGVGFQGTNWQDGDYYKWLEAQVEIYSVTKDPQLLKQITRRAKLIAAAQADDGYITTHCQIGYGIDSPNFKEPKAFKDHVRFMNPGFHETYNMGHLMTLAATHYRVTGSHLLLDVAIKAADCLGKHYTKITKESALMDFNPMEIMGLMELYRCTGEKRFMDYANHFVTQKGHGGLTQSQNDTPLREETKAVGHAVTGTALYNGAADLYAETGDPQLLTALKSIWNDIYRRKASITGGLGNTHGAMSPHHRNQVVHEAFTDPFLLHNATAYNETCASFYGAFFSWRMFMITGESKYLDAMERTFYNNLSSMQLDGKSYFYTNPLRWHGKDQVLKSLDHHHRWTTEESCVCCPTTLARFLAETKEFAYAQGDHSLYVVLYGSNLATTTIDGHRVAIDQKTNYPWDGHIELTYTGDQNVNFALKLRIPAWANHASYTLNGKSYNVDAGTFASISKVWKQGEKVTLELNMEPRLMQANPMVEEATNEAAVMYGPLVYCVETKDYVTPGIEIEDLMLPSNPQFSVKYKRQLLGGINTIRVSNAYRRMESFDENKLYAPIDNRIRPTFFTMIPYYAWANRGDYKMSVFFPIKWNSNELK